MADLTLEDIKKNKKVRIYLERADHHLEALGYTEHGLRHANITARRARELFTKLNYDKKDAELAAIAGFLHDIGNTINRSSHGQIGALISQRILEEMGMDISDIVTVINAIGNHEEASGDPTDIISAALILGDKSDVHRSRVRNPKMVSFDIHDRVNYAVTESSLKVGQRQGSSEKVITMELTIDTKISQVMEYFEIFLSRMIISRKAAGILSCTFQLTINNVELL